MARPYQPPYLGHSNRRVTFSDDVKTAYDLLATVFDSDEYKALTETDSGAAQMANQLEAEAKRLRGEGGSAAQMGAKRSTTHLRPDHAGRLARIAKVEHYAGCNEVEKALNCFSAQSPAFKHLDRARQCWLASQFISTGTLPPGCSL